jgi:hypothetical protein
MLLADLLASHAAHWIDPGQCEAVQILDADKVLPREQLGKGPTVIGKSVGGTSPNPDVPCSTAVEGFDCNERTIPVQVKNRPNGLVDSPDAAVQK